MLRSRRMYKTRIKKWGIDKNQKATEVAEMLRLKQERDSQGKESEFIVRGRTITWAKIEQYLKRDPVLVRKLEENDGVLEMVVGQSSGIICRTPSPDPAASFSVPPPPTASMELELPDEIARLTRNYFDGAMDQGIWTRVGEASYTTRHGFAGAERVRAWGRSMRTARHLVASGDHQEGFQQLGSLLDQVRWLIRDEDPLLLFHLLGNTLGITASGKDLGALICQHLKDLTEIILGPEHPLSRIFDRLNSLAETDSQFTAVPMPIRCLRDLFEARDGPVNPQTLALYDRFAGLLRSPSQQPEAGGQVMSLQQIVDYSEGSQNIHALLRFSFTYLSYLCDIMARDEVLSSDETASEQAEREAEGGEARIVGFRDATHFYVFDAELLSLVVRERGGASPSILYEVETVGSTLR